MTWTLCLEMIMSEKLQIEVMVAGIGWSPIEIEDLVAGDDIRILDENGTVREYGDKKQTTFVLLADAYQSDEGDWRIDFA